MATATVREAAVMILLYPRSGVDGAGETGAGEWTFALPAIADGGVDDG